ncbi:MAG: hypothetical protein Q8N77_03515 [Nanoarchaeota archaeon]|nr:hypothetical protein [Nanoarchaeota archaeon]
MKIPQIFLPETSLEDKTRELLHPSEEVIIINSYKRMKYSKHGTDYMLEYVHKEIEGEVWELWDKEFHEVRWYRREIDSAAEEVLECLLQPVVELFGLKERDYSLAKDNAKKVLERFALKDERKKRRIKDKLYGQGSVTLYRKGCKLIKLKEFYQLDWQRY